MIHMLSRFDLKQDREFDEFRFSYDAFVEFMRGKGLVEASSEIGRRVADTPMDTDANNAPEYYTIMTFRDRKQLDDAYAHMTEPAIDGATAHRTLHDAADNFVFTCWQDIT